MNMLMIPHSAAVHIPLALAVLFPLAHVARLILTRTGFLPHRTWILLWALCAIQVATSGLSYISGQRDRALSSAASELLNSHQEQALLFTLLWVAILAIYPDGSWLRKRRWLVALHHLTLISFLVAQLVVAISLGHLGGKIVFG